MDKLEEALKQFGVWNPAVHSLDGNLSESQKIARTIRRAEDYAKLKGALKPTTSVIESPLPRTEDTRFTSMVSKTNMAPKIRRPYNYGEVINRNIK